MKKLITMLAVLSVVAALQPAHAAKKPKAAKTTLYMHGVHQLGEVDGIDWLANGAPPMQMTTAEPDAQEAKSMATGNPALNKSCTGLPLGFPTWEATGLSGTVVGDAKLKLHFVSPPTRVTARLWIDTPLFSCNDAYVLPTSEVVVDVPPGHNEVEIVFPKLKHKATFNMIVEILGSGSGQAGRLFYDSTDMASALTFTCIPKSGKDCI
ncbi:MAG TPA: hypothetical protein VG929_08875 [Actinomycetota bacterium]|nr:hypothetical protein [Actinomycetota bacterium]